MKRSFLKNLYFENARVTTKEIIKNKKPIAADSTKSKIFF